MSNIDRILKIVDKAINIEKELLYESTMNKSVPIDNFLNRCVSYLDNINSLSVPIEHSKDKNRCKKIVEEIYRGLQKYKGPERQDYNMKRNIGIDDMSAEDESRVLESAMAYSGGGLGFAHVNWNAALLMSTHAKEEEQFDPYWRPTKVKPVREVDPSEYDGIMAEHEANRRQTHAEWEKEMAKQKREVLSEVQRMQ